MKRIIFALFVFVQFSAYAYYEIPDAIPSPNAASLGTYGIIPVSLYTGTPNISIPLYTFESRGLKLPVTLRYDASGVKVNQLPSWLGHNWSLEAGGVITRTIKGRCDEYVPQDNPQAPPYYQSYNLLQEYYDTQNINRLDLNTYGYFYDFSPDIYHFSFLGYSGYFFLDHEGKWRVQSESNLDIVFDYLDDSNYIYPFVDHLMSGFPMPKSFKGFIIRDEKGYEYEFGGSSSAIEYTTPFFNMAEWNAMSWYLSEIRDMYGNVLYSFDYERGKYIIQIYSNEEHTESYSSINSPFGGESFKSKITEGFQYSIYFTSPIYLKRIESSNGVVGQFQSCDNEDYELHGTDTIFYMDTPRLFDKLFVFDGLRLGTNALHGVMESLCQTNESVDNICFFYLSDEASNLDPSLAQFIYNPENIPSTDLLGRTRLRKLENAVFKIDSDTVENHRGIGYQFKYKYNGRMHLDQIIIKDYDDIHSLNEEEGEIGRYRFGYDHFGEIDSDYLTDADHWGYYSENHIPNTSEGYRDPDFYFTKLGSLTEIQYPTGGTTEFEYEPNDYGSYLSDDKLSMVNCSSNGKGGGLRIKSVKNWDSPAHTKLLGRKSYSYNYPGTIHSSGELSVLPKYIWENWTANTVQGSTYQLSTVRENPIIPLSNSFGPSLGYSCVTETNLDGSYIIHHFSNISDPLIRDERYFLDFQNGLVTPYEGNWSNKSFMRGKLLLTTSYGSNGDKCRSIGYIYRSASELNDKYAIMCDLGCISTESSNGSSNPGFYTGGLYKVYYSRLDLIEENDTIFESNGFLTTKTRYAKKDYALELDSPYTHTTDIRVDSSLIVSRSGQTSRTDYVYSTGFQSQLYRNKFCLVPESKDTYLNNVLTKSTRTIYKTEHGLLVPSKEQEKVGANGPYFDRVIYKSYDTKGTLTEYEKNGVDIQLTWDSTGNRILESRAANLSNIYEYDKFAGITKMTLANGSTKNFDYDDCGRLLKEKINNQTTSRYEYNFRDTDTLVCEEAYQRIASTCSVSASILGHTSDQQKTFEIVGLPQEVNIMVNVSTNQNYTYAGAVINGPSYSRSFHVYNKNENINETLTELLYPGVYIIRALISESNYSSGNTTRAQISVNYDILE